MDSHVHLHPPFESAAALDQAVLNMTAAGRGLGLDSAPLHCLMLAEMSEERMDRRLDALRRGERQWTAHPLEGGLSYRAHREDGAVVFLVRGRQVATQDGLELLALGTVAPFPERPSLEAAIHRAQEIGALPVIPWGFGKWWRGRANRIRRALTADPPVLIGDNGGRWRQWPRPRLFDEAESLGVSVLPGSDPLPLRGQVSRVGSYGLVLYTALDRSAPARFLLDRLRSADPPVQVFGRRASLSQFVRDQVAMQLRARRRP